MWKSQKWKEFENAPYANLESSRFINSELGSVARSGGEGAYVHGRQGAGAPKWGFFYGAFYVRIVYNVILTVILY